MLLRPFTATTFPLRSLPDLIGLFLSTVRMPAVTCVGTCRFAGASSEKGTPWSCAIESETTLAKPISTAPDATAAEIAAPLVIGVNSTS